jgi:hypothetical protein
MIRSGTLEAARANRRFLTLPNGTTYWKSDFIQSAAEDRPAPQAFLIEQDPNTEIRSHYHQQDQFQVVIGGEGTLGRHRVAPVSVHYAGRYTGYGPIRAGGGGVHYFSLRPVTTANAYYLPESRGEMLDVPRRHVLGEPVPVSSAQALGARTAAAIDAPIAPQADGLAAWLMRLPPRASAPVPATAGAGERFYLVCGGGLRLEGAVLPRLSVLFATADEDGFAAAAGDEGLELLVMQFPRTPATGA